MGIWTLRAKVAILWLVLTLLVVGVVAWAISAEVVMGAMRDTARKNSDISSMRLHQNFDNSDDFSINRINTKVGDSRKSGNSRNSETALMREVHEEEQTNKIHNHKLKPHNKVYNYDDKQSEDKYSLDDEEEAEESEEAVETMQVFADKVSTTKKPFSIDLDFGKLRKSLTGAQVAQVIDRLMAQRKALNPKETNTPQIVVVAPVAEPSPKKSKTSTTSPISSTPFAKSKSQKSAKSTTTTTTTTTTKRPSMSRSTLKPLNQSRIQSLSLMLANSAITTSKPKRTKLKINTIKIRRTTTTATPSTTSTTTTRKPVNTSAKHKSRSRKTSSKLSKSGSSKSTTTTTTQSSVTTLSSSQFEALKSKIRQKELEFILSKVESLEKQQKRFLKQSKEQDLMAENSFQENVFKPKPQVIPHRHRYPEYSYGYSSGHNYEYHPQHNENPNHNSYSAGWQPSMRPPPHLPPPPPPPPLPNVPPPPPPPHNPPPNGPNVFQSPIVHNSNNQHMYGTHHMPPQPAPHRPPPPQPYAETQSIPHISGKPLIPEQNMIPMNNALKSGKLFNGVLPIPNNRAINLGNNADHFVAQESHEMPYQIKQRGHTAHRTEKPGIQLSFGGGPMGGGGQLKTSPMGIFKTLLLPLLPKPRMNLNGKVVFGVVLENGVGFGKKPKLVAQHFSTGHI